MTGKGVQGLCQGAVCEVCKRNIARGDFKSFLLGSQDLKVNLCGLQQDIRSDGVK